MSDEDVRALFRRVDDGPPLGIDVHEVVARGHQVRARRTKLAVAGSALVVAAAAVVVGLSVGGGVRAPDIERPANPSSVTPTSEKPSPPPGQTAPPDETQQPHPPESAPGAGNTGAPPAVPGAGEPPQSAG